METTTILFIIVFAVLIWLYIQNCKEDFYIEPNTIVGGAIPQSGMEMTTDGSYQEYSAPLELEGPGDAAWSGY
jgi:hypothetical protein